MPEQIYFTPERTVWGRPNLDERGALICKSECRSCVHWQRTGRVVGALEDSAGCGLHHHGFPNVPDCGDYAREPGSDDE